MRERPKVIPIELESVPAVGMSEESADDERVAQVVRSVIRAAPLSQADIDQLISLLTAVVIRARAEERQRWRAVRDVVAEQVQDGGVWFTAQTAAEAYLQQELRKLHAAVEAL